jgi:16S rRNA (cytosine967-C5)-methyltransferase
VAASNANPRSLAARIIEDVLQRGRSLDRALESQALTGQLRAGAQDLSYAVLRSYGLLDAVLGKLLTRPVTDPPLRYLLLVGLGELLQQRTPAYAVVNETVSAAPPRARGLVNAVLRNFQRRREALIAEARQDPVARWNHPDWWIERLRNQYPESWKAVLTAVNGHPPMTLRVNRRRTTTVDHLELLEQSGIEAEETGASALTLVRPVPVAELPGFAQGLVSVQDLGAQCAAPLLDCADGMRVLDACAAPGGKTGHLLELHDLDLTALDQDPGRLDRVRENLDRLALQARLMVADSGRPGDWWDGRLYDRILLDAPCTASGVVRRHPDGKWLKRPEDATRLADAQARLLDVLWPLLVAGGKLLYATCSLFREENADRVESFLARHGDARCEPLMLPGALEGQLLPDDRHDGFFYARLVKT